jgi:hypothetical protein
MGSQLEVRNETVPDDGPKFREIFDEQNCQDARCIRRCKAHLKHNININRKGFDSLRLEMLFYSFLAALVATLVATTESSVPVTDLATLHQTNTSSISVLGEAWSTTGDSVAHLGDFNGDGLNDFIVGAPFYSEAAVGVTDGNHCGAVFVILGRPISFHVEYDVTTFTSGSHGLKVIGPGANRHLGKVVGAAGDINDDGMDDALMGATSHGTIFAVFGSAGPYTNLLTSTFTAGVHGFLIRGDAALSFLSMGRGCLSGKLGDMNGDGFDDFAIGAVGAEDYAGSVFLVYGKSSAAAVVDIDLDSFGSEGVVWSGGVGGYTGDAIHSAGDVNGDGFNDVIFASAYAAYLIYGSITPASIDLSTFRSGAQGIRFFNSSTPFGGGTSVNGAGDTNGDGLADILIGSPREARVFVIYGSSAVPTADIDLATFTTGPTGYIIHRPAYHGAYAGNDFGGNVAPAGDINQDGIDDFVVSARSTDDGVGTVYLFFGNATAPDADIDLATYEDMWMFTAPSDPAALGTSLDGGVDVTGDGIPDLLMGAPDAFINTDPHVYYPRIYSGAAYVLPGPFSLEHVPTANPALAPTRAPTAVPTARPTAHERKLTLDIKQVSMSL